MLKGVLCLLAAASVAGAARVPAGTKIQVRLNTAVSTASAKSGQLVDTVVIAPVLAGGEIAIAPGTRISGHIATVSRPATSKDQAVMAIEFDTIKSVDGTTAPVAARLAAVDNARETVDEQGRILGIVAAETGSGRLDQGISKVAQRYPGLANILSAAKEAVVREADANIAYDPGVEMTLELRKPLEWSHPGRVPDIQAIPHADQLLRLVNSEPDRTVAENPPQPSDITNLMFIGNAQQIAAAFNAAGWSTAEALNEQSKLETFRAITEMRGYKEAPVSVLLLDGQRPDMVFEKQNNTFAMRHHLRIWRRPGRFDGKPIWVCAATHDIGIDFSDRDYTFIHKVDTHIDDERAKVVNDLLFTGNVRGLSLVDRSATPKTGYNATGDAFETDGRMAVLEF